MNTTRYKPQPRVPQREHRIGPTPASMASHLWVLVALLALLALTAGIAWVPMGAFNTVANVGIAVAKALLVMMFYMRLKADKPVLHIVAAIGFVWLAVLLALSLGDMLTRVPLLGT